MSEIEKKFEDLINGSNKELVSKLKRKLIIEYTIDGEDGGIWCIILHEGKIQIIPGERSDYTIRLRFKNKDCFLRYYNKEFNEYKGYQIGCLSFSGSLDILKHYNRFIGLRSF